MSRHRDPRRNAGLGRGFSESKIRRDRLGRFAVKPDKYRVSAYLKTLKQDKALIEAREAAYRKMRPSQRRRLLQTLTLKDMQNAKPTLSPPTTKEQTLVSPKAQNGTKKPKANRRAQVNALKDKKEKPKEPGKKKHITWKGDELTIWSNSRHGTHKQGYTMTQTPGFSYSVDQNGQKLLLNKWSNTAKFAGEDIHGMPELQPRLKTYSNKELTEKFTYFQAQTESSNPNSPKWIPDDHGEVEKKYLAKAGYGAMEIHHINQWSRTRFNEITEEYQAGTITKQQAQDKMRSLLQPDKDIGTGYSIRVQSQADRAYVILPAGAHNFTSPLYLANHPMGIHPDSGEMVKFGIPKQGAGGREEFNSFRKGFWRETYKRETFRTVEEINRRIKDGSLTKDEAQKLIEEARAAQSKAVKDHTNT
jgi:hypothetical protein